ncbi:MAG: hypothetical protein ACI4LN_00195, partial [Anaerovoracaceae bacterium]
MRRKNLILTIGFILLLALLHSAGVPLARSAFADCTDSDRMEPFSVYGKITGLEEREKGGYRLQVLVESVDEKPLQKKEKIL